MRKKNVKNKPFVSVIIPTYNDWFRLDRCLSALSNQTYPREKFEIIVVNNNAFDIVPEEIKKYKVNIFTECKAGSYAARNKGLSVAKGEVIAFTDSDCIPDQYWIDRAIDRFDQGCDRLAGHIRIFPMHSSPNIAELYDMTFGFDQETSASSGLSVTANMFASSSLFTKYGKFNDSLLSGGDTEWSRRVYRQGVGIEYAPEVIVQHPARRTLRELFHKRYRVSAKTTIGRGRNQNKTINSTRKIYKKRLLYLFSNKGAFFKGFIVLIVAIALKTYSKLVRVLFKLRILNSIN